MDKGGFEPPASRMRSGRATVALLARYNKLGGQGFKKRVRREVKSDDFLPVFIENVNNVHRA